MHWSKLHGLVEQRLRGTVEQSGGLTDSMVQELVTKQLELAGLNSAINEVHVHVHYCMYSLVTAIVLSCPLDQGTVVSGPG